MNEELWILKHLYLYALRPIGTYYPINMQTISRRGQIP